MFGAMPTLVLTSKLVPKRGGRRGGRRGGLARPGAPVLLRCCVTRGPVLVLESGSPAGSNLQAVYR